MKSTLARHDALTARKLALDFDEKKIDAIFADLNQCRLPGAAVGIAIRGEPVYRRGFGLANMELPVVLSPSIRMRIGSTTKHFTALAYALLCEAGKAGLDDPLVKYLPELHPVTHSVTALQLMGNTSGLRDACDIRIQFSGMEGRAVTCEELLSFYRTIGDVNAAPGTSWIYNNGGWILLSVMIERITGQSLEEVLRTRIFEPIGMHDTLLRRWDTNFVPNSAVGHLPSPGGGFEKYYWDLDFAGAGAMVATVDDMLRWLAHMDKPTVGNASTWQLMKAPQRLTNGTSTGYGLGLTTSWYRGVETLHHAGGWSGANAQMLKVPAAGLDITVMVNRGDVSAMLLTNQIVDACLLGLEPVKHAAEGAGSTGTFLSPTTGRAIQLFFSNGQQYVSLDGRDTPSEPDDHGVLWPIGESVHLKRAVTLVGDRSRPSSIRLSDFGNLDELLPARAGSNPDIKGISGCYRSDTTGTDAIISETENGPRLRTSGRFGSVELGLECIAPETWRAKPLGVILPPGGILSFDSDGKEFHFSNSLTRSLCFRRVT